ncbi:uncharacterized protein MICPUCDRAFT_56445 [Micromonas pusilla CCMP1545]|uniref:Transmembrane protein 231 n=1 Tax=Micromonas pusilla (strain CCMP1545) TaxID=564608 RepID=C1MM94_MICPC|nr:uncharacterized protein MICPUCDRAFT_56445 [Micromonas pusilla CCMP1545]EEH59007.1 predicted protein [Micromonas pusilla CCMP1545]|eukprot:XP_003057362.1 predicted protein [Micromonas pusilla CCMP1545]
MVQVYTEPFARRHYAPYLSVGFLYRPLCIIVSFVLAFTVCLTVGGLWVKTHSYIVQPSVRFKYDALMIFETNQTSKYRVWSTMASVNQLHAKHLASVDISASEQDVNSDGKIDLIDIECVVAGLAGVKKVTALFAFDYELAGTVTMAMNSMAYVQGSSPTSGSGMFVDGYLKLEQMDAIRADTSRYDYNYSVFPFAEHGELVTQMREATELQIATVMNAYIARNETTHYDYKYPVWMSAESPDFTFQARIRIPASQQVLYRPGFLELCKYAWVQILSTYLIFWWLFTKFEWVVFHFRIVPTRVVSDLQTKSHRF